MMGETSSVEEKVRLSVLSHVTILIFEKKFPRVLCLLDMLVAFVDQARFVISCFKDPS
jgi:hypothetical protein